MISASQEDKARTCIRRWLFDWQTPFDQREAQSPEAAIGEEIHTVAQDYHERGIAPNRHTLAGAIFFPALPWVPKPQVGRCEGKFELTVSGIQYSGYIDLECMASDLPQRQVKIEYDMPAVVDYKSKKNFNSILDGPGDFYNDSQAIIYAARALVKYKSDAVYMRWLNLKREGTHKAKPSDCVMTRKETTDAFRRLIHPTAQVLIQLKNKRDLNPLTLPPSPASCMKYGIKYACPHIAKCNLGPEDKLLALEDTDTTERKMMDLLAMLESMPDNTAAATQAAEPEIKKAEPLINPPESPKYSGSQAVDQAVPTVASKVALAEKSITSMSDEEIGQVVRFLFGK